MAQSPRDVLESLAYVVCYFRRGRLPGQAGEHIELVLEPKEKQDTGETFSWIPS
jgi:hypothetical protein